MARAGKAAAIAFTVVYGIILFYVAFQAFWLIKQRHRKTSFKMGFNVLTMLWCVDAVVSCKELRSRSRSLLQESIAYFGLGQLLR